MSAAKCFAASSDAADRETDRTMSRIGKKPVAVPKGVTANVEGQTVTAKGPKGQLAVALVDQVSVAMTDGGVKVEPRDQSKEARSHVGHVAHAGAEHHDRRHRRLREAAGDQRRRLSRAGRRQEPQSGARLQPRREVPRSRRGSRSRRRSRRRSSSAASTSRRSARWRRRSGAGGRRSRTRARA